MSWLFVTLLVTSNSKERLIYKCDSYNQVLHLVSAARGAEQFYTIEHHSSRSECIELARELDLKAAEAWVGHPYVDLVDNSKDFESKINELIVKVAWSIGIDVGDRLRSGSKKFKFVVNGSLPADSVSCCVRIPAIRGSYIYETLFAYS